MKIILIYFMSIVLFFMILPILPIGIALSFDKVLGFSTMIYPPYNLIIALLFLFFGAFWMFWSLIFLIKIGQGNPQEFFGQEILPAAQKLVVSGPYRYTRNPMVFGWFMIVTGIAIYLGSIFMLLVVIPIILGLVVCYLKYFEEPKLVNRFGENYLEYRKKVPMIFPMGGK